MKRAEIKEIISGTKKEGHARVRFVCPTCSKVHEMRLHVFDKIEDGKYPCSNNRSRNFKAWVDTQIRNLSPEQVRTAREMISEGKAFSTIKKRLNLRHETVLHALVSAEYSHYRPAIQTAEALPTASAPAPTIINNYHAPVTNIYEAPARKAEPVIPAVYSRPMPGTVAFDKLSFREKLEIQSELARIQRECN